MGVVLTNEVYDSVHIPYQHDEQEEMKQSYKRFLNKPALKLAALVETIIFQW